LFSPVPSRVSMKMPSWVFGEQVATTTRFRRCPVSDKGLSIMEEQSVCRIQRLHRILFLLVINSEC
jgi:hypothetical protein